MAQLSPLTAERQSQHCITPIDSHHQHSSHLLHHSKGDNNNNVEQHRKRLHKSTIITEMPSAFGVIDPEVHILYFKYNLTCLAWLTLKVVVSSAIHTS